MTERITTAEITALSLKAQALTEKLRHAAELIRDQSGFAEEFTQPASHGVVFARLASEAADLSGAILFLIAERDRQKPAP